MKYPLTKKQEKYFRLVYLIRTNCIKNKWNGINLLNDFSIPMLKSILTKNKLLKNELL